MIEALERHQVWLYLLALAAGMAVGAAAPGINAGWEVLVLSVLGGLLYVTFTQPPLVRLGREVRDASPALRLGVLLVPCTEWFIGFTHQGGGDGGRALAAAPSC